MSTMRAVSQGQHARDWALWPWWVLASAAGIGFGFVALYAVFFAVKAVVPHLNEDRLFGWAFGPLLVLSLASAQWLVLRRRVPRSGLWILATVVGLALGVGVTAVVVGLVPSLTSPGADMRLFSLVMLTLLGGGLGLAQLVVLRHHLRMPGLWVAINALAWLLLGLLIGKSIDRMLDVVAIGVVPAACAGLALVLLWRPQEADTTTGGDR
jgi:hypothetical protein